MLVCFAPTHSHFAGTVLEDAFLFMAEPLDHSIHDLWLAMAELTIVDVETDSELLLVDNLVCNAGVVRIQHESDVRQTLDKLATLAKQASDHSTI
jgi:hypothetical protein